MQWEWVESKVLGKNEMLVVLIADEDSDVFGDWQELSSGCCYTLKRSEKCYLGGARDGHETRKTQLQECSSQSD
ncbi:hypothetical protein GJ744_009403 [Endocarpon pusillum]|uniref:Uncharacterized protein n=1 Tax=Endocarpon pusillum TaxID=364733 RepID=A0A8H7E4W6_9EURO|nr:hypothetical protein GJ744_009403 [Endocarpon pusillum]